jgi:hypothetical protein
MQRLQSGRIIRRDIGASAAKIRRYPCRYVYAGAQQMGASILLLKTNVRRKTMSEERYQETEE